MKRIGIKSSILLCIVFALAANAAYHHLFDIRRILGLQPSVLFLIGGLASLASLSLSFFLKGSRESPFHFSWGRMELRPAGAHTLLSFRGKVLCLVKRSEAPAWELSGFPFALFAGLGFMIAGLTILENRSLLLLDHFYRNFTKDYVHICPKDGEEALIVPEKPTKYGCDLVKKAFSLGYTKDLGDCADDPQLTEAEVCKDRQWDEPSLHYSYRLVERFARGLMASTATLQHSLNKESLRQRTAELPDLSRSHAQSFIGAPRSSYHIFTDLKEPGSFGDRMRRFLHPNHCQDALRELRFQLATEGRAPGSQLEDAIAHLLFNPTVGLGSDSCRPYTIHWQSAPGTCAELIADSEKTLAELGISHELSVVLERQRLEKAFPAASPKPVPAERPDALTPPPVSIAVKPPAERPRISFHCLMTQAVPLANGSITINEQSFAVVSATLPAPGAHGIMPSQALMQAVAGALAPGFSYNNLDRQMPISIGEARFRQENARSGRELQLAKLELLRFSDVLAGDQWLENYPEYMEVYPWQPHLSNFASRFRRAYHRENLDQ